MSVPFLYLRVVIIILSAFLLLSGCFRPAGLDLKIQALHDQIEKRSLHQAKLAFFQADYSTAVLLLNRFLRNHPESPRSLEARWWLARAYQETGDLSSAVECFRLLVNTPTWNVYQTEAHLRMTQLEDRLKESTASGLIKGILVSLGSIQTPSDLDSVISASQAIERSVILLDVPCGVDENVSDNGRPFSLNGTRTVIQRMHSHGIPVYLGVTLRCLGSLAQEQRDKLENWKDWNYDPRTSRLQRSPYYSLNFEGYQAFLVYWITQLRDLPLTGLVIRNEVPLGLYEGFSPLTVKAFTQEFGVDFHPVRMFNEYRYRAMPTTDSDSSVQLPAVFWKWAGWKTRDRHRIVLNLIQTLRVRLPRLQFGITVQLQSVTDPLQGLIHFAEDWIDVARGPFDMFLMTMEDPKPPIVLPISQGFPAAFSEAWTEDGVVPVEQIVQQVGQPEKLWIILPRQAVHAPTRSRIVPEEVGRIYDYRVVP